MPLCTTGKLAQVSGGALGGDLRCRVRAQLGIPRAVAHSHGQGWHPHMYVDVRVPQGFCTAFRRLLVGVSFTMPAASFLFFSCEPWLQWGLARVSLPESYLALHIMSYPCCQLSH